MYYVGLFPKFKVNRPLVPEERKLQLRQNRKVLLEPTREGLNNSIFAGRQ